MGAGWCKRDSKSNGTESPLQDMLNKWADRLNCGNEETKWNRKWARRRQSKWKDRPEISAPRLINPCFLHGAKWDNVILSVPDPEMKSRIPVAPPRRKRKRRLESDSAQVYQTLSFPDFRHRCFDLGTDTSMSLSSLDPLGPRSPRTPWTPKELRRLSLDYSDCDCSISSRTSLASIPVTDELYRKHHFLSVSGQSFNMTQASLLSASASFPKRNQLQKRRKTLQSIANKYNLTLSLPNLNHLSSKYSRDGGIKYAEKREFCLFSSLPDLSRPNDITKEAVMYAVLYGIKSDYGVNFRSKTCARGVNKPWLRKDGENQNLMRKSGSYQGRPISQMSASRFGNNLTHTIQEGSDAISEDQEEGLTIQNRPTSCQDDDRVKNQVNSKQHGIKMNLGYNLIPSWNSQNSVSQVEYTENVLPETAAINPTNDLNLKDRVGERSLNCREVKFSVPNTKTSSVQEPPSLINVQVHGAPTNPEYVRSRTGRREDKTFSAEDSTSRISESEVNSNRTDRLPFDNANKENFDSNLLFKYRNLSKFKSPRYLKTFRRLSQRQTEKVGCPLFFDKHHSCSCLRGRGQRFQSMSVLPTEKPTRFSLKNGQIKKSLSVNHSQQGRKMDRIFKSSLCESHNDCCSHNDPGRAMTLSDRNNNLRDENRVVLDEKPLNIDKNACILQVNDIAQVSSGLNSSGDNNCVYLKNGLAQNRENGCIYVGNETIDDKKNNHPSLVNTLDQNCVNEYKLSVNGSIPSEQNRCVLVVNGTVQDGSVSEMLEQGTTKNTIVSSVNSRPKYFNNTSAANDVSAFNSSGTTDIDLSSTKISIIHNDHEARQAHLRKEIEFDSSVFDKSVKISNPTDGSNSTKIPIVFDDRKWDSDSPAEQLKTIVKIGDVTLSRRSSTSDSLCELEDAIYDMLVVSSTNQLTAEVKN